jgi:hypothetical protein
MVRATGQACLLREIWLSLKIDKILNLNLGRKYYSARCLDLSPRNADAHTAIRADLPWHRDQFAIHFLLLQELLNSYCMARGIDQDD